MQSPANKDLVTIRTAQFDGEVALGNLGAAETLDFSTGAFQYGTLDQNCAITVNTGSFPGMGRYQLRLINNGTFTVTWAGTGYSASRWIGATSAPAVNTATNGETIITFFWNTTNATQVLGRVGAV